MYLTIVKDTGRCCPDAKAFDPGKSGFFCQKKRLRRSPALRIRFPATPAPATNVPAPCGIFSSNRFFLPRSLPDTPHFSFGGMTTTALPGSAHSFSRNPDTRDETLRHLAAFSQATVFCPHSLPDTPHFSFGGMTTTALPGSAHSFSRNPDTRDETLRHLAAFSQATVFCPHSLPDTPHFSFGGMTTTALPGSAHSFSRNPDTRDETLRHLAAFSQATVFCPHSLPDTPHFSFGGMTTTALPGSAAARLRFKFLHK